MGLDMYLDKKIYIGNNYAHNRKTKIAIKGVNSDKVKYIIEEAYYWRKNNAIHKWFVDNVQEGIDDCHEYDVSVDQLKELLKLVTKTVEYKILASEILPTQGGFFFGETDYDEYYFQDMVATKKGLEELLKDVKPNEEFTYQSSW